MKPTFKIKDGDRTLIYQPVSKNASGVSATLVGYIKGRVKFMYALLVCSLLAMSITGCSTLTSPTTLQRIQTGSKVAAYVGTHTYLQSHPDEVKNFEDVAGALEILATSPEAIDYLTLIAVMNKLPIKELKSPEAQLAITAATIILSDYAGTLTIDQTQALKPLAGSFAAGIRLGVK